MLSSLEKQEYREHKGKICPYCGKESVSVMKPAQDPKVINQDRSIQNMRCNSCKMVWNEVYPIFDIEENTSEQTSDSKRKDSSKK